MPNTAIRTVLQRQTHKEDVRFEVFTAMTMKNGIFWDVTPYGYWFLHEPHGVTSQKMLFYIKKKSSTTGLNTVLASVYTQTTE
jgi:hypothetical protein